VLGTYLLDDDHGWDPYLEDVGTLWVLHWHGVSAVTQLPVWWAVINDLAALEFTESDLLRFASDEVAATTWAQPTESSIIKDVDCLLRMYAPRKTRKGRQTLDDLLDSPFRELGLIVPAPGDSDAYRFVRGHKPTLAPEVLLYACLDYLARFEPDSRTATITRLAADSGTPGRIFKLTEEVILEAAEVVAATDDRVAVAAPAGATQIVFDGDPAEIATDVLHGYYAARRPGIGRPKGLVAGSSARDIPQDLDATPQVAPAGAPKIGSRTHRQKTGVMQRLHDAQRRIDADQSGTSRRSGGHR
jgi:hypothetical protein